MQSNKVDKHFTKFEFYRSSGAISCLAPSLDSLQRLPASTIRAKWDKAILSASSKSQIFYL
jgi:hypothetical protein